MNGKEKSRSDAAASMKKSVPKSENKKRQQSENAEEDEDASIPEKDPSLSRNNCQRRSSRNKKHVSHMKYLSDDDDNLQSPKKSRGGASPTDVKEKMKDATADVASSKVGNSSVRRDTIDGHKKGIKCEVPAPHSEVLPNMNPECEKLKVMREGTNMSDQNDKNYEVQDVDAERSNVKEVHVLVSADPEFSDFDQDKREKCFAVNQVWAIYDSTCGMPRFYARIRKVFSPGSKLQITWFEPVPDDKGEIDWCDAELPVACGKYTLGGTEETVDLLTFSHLVHCPKRGPRSAYLMYPRKGETWALFKNWDIRWSSNPENHANFEYEFVEILSDYVEDAGISVAYMDKVKGFVCLFETTEEHRLNSFQIPPKDFYRFSHQIPSFRMTGKERKGVPKGSFELDPSALPGNINDDHDDPVSPTFDQGQVPQNKVAPKHGSDQKSRVRSTGVDQVPRESNTAGNDLKAKAGRQQKAHEDVEYGQGNSVKPKSDAEMNGKEKSRSDAATSIGKEVPKSENKNRRQKSANNSGNGQEDEDDNISEKDPSLSRDNCEKKHVSYMKYLSDDNDNLQCPKKSRRSASPTDLEEKMKYATENVAAALILYRFAHQIPPFRITGKERGGILKGLFELDPSALPANINGHNDLNNVKGETDDAAAVSGRTDPPHAGKSPEAEVEVISFEDNQAANVQKESNAKKSNPKSEASILRRSQRKSHPSENGSKDASQNGLSTHKECSAIRTNGGTNTPKKHGKNGIDRETMILIRSTSRLEPEKCRLVYERRRTKCRSVYERRAGNLILPELETNLGGSLVS